MENSDSVGNQCCQKGRALHKVVFLSRDTDPLPLEIVVKAIRMSDRERKPIYKILENPLVATIFKMFAPSLNIEARLNRKPSHPIVGHPCFPNNPGNISKTIMSLRGGRPIRTYKSNISVVM